jgi:hypothetical protein
MFYNIKIVIGFYLQIHYFCRIINLKKYIMTTKPSNMSLSDLLTNSTLMSDNIKLNAGNISRYGLNLPMFTDQMDADARQVDALNKEQERLKSELKSKTEELTLLKDKLNESYALAKKTVKLAEPQPNWVAYGITDKK